MPTVAVHGAARLTGIAPQFVVDDLRLAITYYRDNLGFQLDFERHSFYASVTRDGFAIYLKHAPKLAADREHQKRNEHLDTYISASGIADLFSDLEMPGAHMVRMKGSGQAATFTSRILTATFSASVNGPPESWLQAPGAVARLA
jgi:hypothetical protein